MKNSLICPRLYPTMSCIFDSERASIDSSTNLRACAFGTSNLSEIDLASVIPDRYNLLYQFITRCFKDAIGWVVCVVICYLNQCPLPQSRFKVFLIVDDFFNHSREFFRGLNRESPNKHVRERIFTADVNETLVHSGFPTCGCPSMVRRHKDRIEIIGATEIGILAVKRDGSVFVIIMGISNEEDISRSRLLPTVISVSEEPPDRKRVKQTIAEFIVDVADINNHGRQTL